MGLLIPEPGFESQPGHIPFKDSCSVLMCGSICRLLGNTANVNSKEGQSGAPWSLVALPPIAPIGQLDAVLVVLLGFQGSTENGHLPLTTPRHTAPLPSTPDRALPCQTFACRA